MAGKTNWGAQSIEEATGGGDVSKINAAQIINIRTQNNWTMCDRAYGSGDFDKLRDTLNVLWTEFYADAKSPEKEKVLFFDKVIKTHSILARKFVKEKKESMKHINLYRQAIYDKWLFLKTVEKSQGIGKAYIDPDADDWE